jgi:PAS domain S-box-containing protein
MAEMRDFAGKNRLKHRELLRPAGVFLVITAAVSAFSWTVAEQERERIRVETDTTAEQVRLRLEAWVDTRTAIIKHMADRWPTVYDVRPEQFRDDATEFVGLYKGIQALNWMDNDYVIRIVVPEAGNEAALGKDLHEHPDANAVPAIVRATESGQTCRTPALELLQEGKGFAAYRPVFNSQGELKGYIDGVFRVSRLVDACLAEPRLRDRFCFLLSETDGQVIYDHRWNELPVRTGYEALAPVRVIDRPWILHMAVAPSALMVAHNNTPRILLGAGLSTALIISLLLFLAIRRQSALLENEVRLRSLFEGIQDVLFVHDDEGRILDCNEAACRKLGYSRPELLLRKTSDIDAPEFAAGFKDRLRDQFSGGRFTFEGVHVTKTGTRIPVDVNTSVIDYRGRRAILAVVRDLTDRKRAEEENRQLMTRVLHSQKLESLGVLSGGIAHDFNNILVSIMGNASLVLDDLPADSPNRDNIREIEQASKLAADLCNQMLAYSGKGKFIVAPVNLNDVVTETQRLLAVSISKNAALKFELAAELPAIEADATQIRQVIMNLLTNASEAIGNQPGTITVTTGAMHCTMPYLQEICAPFMAADALKEGDYAFLEVSDDGSGMDPDTLSRLFEPFFTTKFTGRGLGMAAVLGIVRGHNGAIHVRTAREKGTAIRVLFPVTDRPVQPVESRPVKTDEWRGSGIVLLVDDDDMVTSVAKRILERIGFRVLLARGGLQAIELFQQRAHEIVLVLLDLTMPDMNGDETMKMMRQIQPDVCVVLSSGYTQHEVTQRFTGALPAGFIQKPYQTRELTNVLRQVLDNGR